METKKRAACRPRDPFDDSAGERLRHMGLLTVDGKADKNAMEVFSHIYAGLFYDNLLDNNDSICAVKAVCDRLIERSESEDTRQMMLAICVEHDAMRCTLPEPIWWLAGNMELLPLFVDGFMRCLRNFGENGVM